MRNLQHPWIKTYKIKEQALQRRLDNGQYDSNKLVKKSIRHTIFQNRLLLNPTKTEIIFGDYLYENMVCFKFQKGFFSPFHRIVDFYIPSLMLIIEIDGSSHDDTKGEDRNKDTQFLDRRGMATLRITNAEVLSGAFKGKVAWVLKDAMKRGVSFKFDKKNIRKKNTNHVKTAKQEKAYQKMLFRKERKREYERNARRIAANGWAPS